MSEFQNRIVNEIHTKCENNALDSSHAHLQINRMNQVSQLTAVRIDDVPVVKVGPGCTRRDLPSTDHVRVWVVDMAPGSEWPRVDEHGDTGEEIYIVSGEVIEGDQRYPAGTYMYFSPGTHHRPRTETGVRMFGFNVADR